MLVGKTEITCGTGELIPNLPDSGVRPLVRIEKGGSNHTIYQNERGKLIQSDNTGKLLDHIYSVKLTETEKKAVQSMFSRFNAQVAQEELGKSSLGRMWRRFPGDTISVGLVACSSKKRDVPSKAKDMYLGDLFKKSRRWCELFCDDWAILSAKYGLVFPDEVIEPYDQRLATKDNDIRFWSSGVSFNVYMKWGEDTHFYLLAGVGYRKPFEDHNRRHHASTAPLAGLSIGEQLSWLKNQTKDAPEMQEQGKPKKRKLKLGAPRMAKR